MVLYRAALATETTIEWEEGFFTTHCNVEAGLDCVHTILEGIMNKTGATSRCLALTDYEHNFRNDFDPDYKNNRKLPSRKPISLLQLREALLENTEEEVYLWPGLEGDDVLGILSTRDSYRPDATKVIYSIDKDFQTIPGKLYLEKFEKTVDVTEEMADEYHMMQALAGDPTDGYSGCPGIGTRTALKALRSGRKRVVYQHELKRGPRKGQTEPRADDAKAESPWEIVVSYYEAAGLTEGDALRNARCARILRDQDYHKGRGEPILWQP